MRTLTVAAALAALTTTAHADHTADQLDALNKDLVDVAPLPGRERATPRTPPWCAGVKLTGSWGAHSIERNIKAADRDWKNLLVAARVGCQWPEHPAIKRATAIITQTWINLSALPEAAALESLTLRLDGDRFAADQQKLCSQLVTSGEITGGEDKTFTEVRRTLLGCGGDAMWLDGSRLPDATLDYVDASAGALDPAMQLAVVLDTTKYMFEERGPAFDRSLLAFAAIKPDVEVIAKAKLADLVERAPYQGNTFARAILLESLYSAKRTIAEYQREIAGRDADWKQLVVTAPARAFAEWTESAAKHADAIARSHDFERAFWGASRKAVKGCWPTLRADFLAVLKTLPRGNEVELLQAISAPVPSLLYSRLVACAAVEHPDQHYAAMLIAIGSKLRTSRGPRTAAYHAIVEQLAAIVADRPRFPVALSSLPGAPGEAIRTAAARAKTTSGQGFAGADGTGTVKSIKKVGAGLEVTFVTTKVQVANVVCTETTKLWRIADDGKLIYYQSCKDHGMKWVDQTPDAVTVPTEWASGIAPGAVVQFIAMVGPAPGRTALPLTVHAKKKLVGFVGFGL